MKTYKLISKKIFEKTESFEKRLNEEASKGMQAIGISQENGVIVVLLEKER